MHLPALLTLALLAAVAAAASPALSPRETGAAATASPTSKTPEQALLVHQYNSQLHRLMDDDRRPTPGSATASYYRVINTVATALDITGDLVSFCSKCFAKAEPSPSPAGSEAASQDASYVSAYKSWISVLKPSYLALASSCSEAADERWAARIALLLVAEGYDGCISAGNLQMATATDAGAAGG